MPPKIGIITQARMTSSRLPGKVLLPCAGKSLLQIHIDRLRWANLPIIVATTTNSTDDVIKEFADQQMLSVFRGNENHVLSRFYEAATASNIDVVVRVTSDCPLIDGDMIEKATAHYLSRKNKDLYLSNVLQRTFPRGFDFEIFSYLALKEAYINATDNLDTEHVTPYINKNKSGHVQIEHWLDTTDRSAWRLTVDTKEDLALIKLLIENHGLEKMTYSQIAKFLDAHPDLKKINHHIEQKKV